MSLDSMDRRLLSTLQKRGRISNAELAEAVNLSASACHRRVQRLEAEGYIQGYVALLDPQKLGVSATIFVEITLSTQADEVLDAADAEGAGEAARRLRERRQLVCVSRLYGTTVRRRRGERCFGFAPAGGCDHSGQ